MTRKIEIPKAAYQNIIFPERCHVCSCDSPDAKSNVKASGDSCKPSDEDVFKSWTFDVPVCTSCMRKLSFGRWLSWLLVFPMILCVIMAWFIVSLIFPDMGTVGNVIVLLILVGMGTSIQARIYTPPFDVSPYSYDLLFYYRDDKMGEEFAWLNNVKKITDHNNIDVEFEYYYQESGEQTD